MYLACLEQGLGGRVQTKLMDSRKWGVLMFSSVVLLLVAMNNLSTEFIDSCARELGAKRLRLQLPWELPPLDTVLSSKKPAIISKPEWVEFPLQGSLSVSSVSKTAKLDRFNARRHLSDVSWVGQEAQHSLAMLEGDCPGQHESH